MSVFIATLFRRLAKLPLRSPKWQLSGLQYTDSILVPVIDVTPKETDVETTDMYEWESLSEFIKHSSKKDRVFFSIACVVLILLFTIYVNWPPFRPDTRA